jgi:UDP-N-acetylmuramoyl-L-alanyl-D-glutamate--2,6-diaminopimelate ligase
MSNLGMSKTHCKTLAMLHEFLVDDISDIQGTWDAKMRVCRLSRQANQCDEYSVFIATAGLRTHANSYAADAVLAGARLMITDQLPENLSADLAVWLVPNLPEHMEALAKWFYDDPSQDVTLVGITGTNGKTTTSFLTAQALHQLGYRVALMGTLGAGVCPELVPTGHTTPDIFSIQAWLASARQLGCQYAVMEVSSHAVVQGRISGLSFAVKALTQVTEDHLDFHGSLQAYHQAKINFFTQHFEAKQACWVLNQHDGVGQQLIELALAQAGGDALKTAAYAPCCAPCSKSPVTQPQRNAEVLSLAKQHALKDGYQLQLAWQNQTYSVTSHLLGDYNNENLLCCLRILLVLGFNWRQLLTLVPKLTAPKGRLEQVPCVKPLQVLVDFAHTTDALGRVLTTLNAQRQAAQVKNSIWVVFGCGGDRDKTKRPAMTAAAYALADKLVLTSDNPRTEAVDAIIADMLTGLTEDYDQTRVMIEPDRQLAITTALNLAQSGDWVLVAGKGHETTQEINGHCYVFSDQQIIKEWLP